MASARHLWLSGKMSAAVYMSMNQTSVFEESCPSNVGISCSMVVVRFDSLSVTWKVFMYACVVLCTGSPLGLGAEFSWSVIMRYCSLSVSYISYAVDVD